MLSITKSYHEFRTRYSRHKEDTVDRILVEVVTPGDLPEHPVNDFATWALIDPKRAKNINFPVLEKLRAEVLKAEEALVRNEIEGEGAKLRYHYNWSGVFYVCKHFADHDLLSKYERSVRGAQYDLSKKLIAQTLDIIDSDTREFVRINIRKFLVE